MKEKKLPTVIMLIGGLVASTCCLINRVSLTGTLITVFISLMVFLVIGLIAGKFITEVNDEVKKAEEEEAKRKKEAERQAELEKLRLELAQASEENGEQEEAMETEEAINDLG